MIKECFKNRDFRVLWGAGGMTGIARAMEFLALSLYALQELGLPYLVTMIFAARIVFGRKTILANCIFKLVSGQVDF